MACSPLKNDFYFNVDDLRIFSHTYIYTQTKDSHDIFGFLSTSLFLDDRRHLHQKQEESSERCSGSCDPSTIADWASARIAQNTRVVRSTGGTIKLVNSKNTTLNPFPKILSPKFTLKIKNVPHTHTDEQYDMI